MKKTNPSRYSSAVGKVWIMMTFKIKYCHPIFDMQGVRELCNALFWQAFAYYGIECKKMAFDSDHVHMILEMGLLSKPELAKKLKGFTARKMFTLLPWLKKRYFWESGLWNPSYDGRAEKLEVHMRYLDKQKYADNGQQTIEAFC